MADKRSKLRIDIDGDTAKRVLKSTTSAIQRMYQTSRRTFGDINKSSSSAFKSMGSIGESSIKKVSASMESMKDSVKRSLSVVSNRFTSVFKGIRSAASTITSLKTIFTTLGITGFVRSITHAGMAMQGFESTMSVVAGTTENSRKELRWLMNTANEIGVAFEDVAKPFSKLAASAKDSGMTMAQVRDIFKSIAGASLVLQANGQDVGFMFFALQQMASKSIVSMEELRRQLGERLPGVLVIAAQQMGVTVDKLEKLIQNRLLNAVDFLPALAKGIQEFYGQGLESASKTMLAQMNRLKNAMFELKVEFFQGGFSEILSSLFETLTTTVRNNRGTLVDILNMMVDPIRRVVKWLGELKPEDVSKFFNEASIYLRAFGSALTEILSLIGKLIIKLPEFKDRMIEAIPGVGAFKFMRGMADRVFGQNQAPKKTSEPVAFNDAHVRAYEEASKSAEKINTSVDKSDQSMDRLLDKALDMLDVTTKRESLEGQLANQLTTIDYLMGSIVDSTEDEANKRAKTFQLMSEIKELNKVTAKMATQRARQEEYINSLIGDQSRGMKNLIDDMRSLKGVMDSLESLRNQVTSPRFGKDSASSSDVFTASRGAQKALNEGDYETAVRKITEARDAIQEMANSGEESGFVLKYLIDSVEKVGSKIQTTFKADYLKELEAPFVKVEERLKKIQDAKIKIGADTSDAEKSLDSFEKKASRPVTKVINVEYNVAGGKQKDVGVLERVTDIDDTARGSGRP